MPRPPIVPGDWGQRRISDEPEKFLWPVSRQRGELQAEEFVGVLGHDAATPEECVFDIVVCHIGCRDDDVGSFLPGFRGDLASVPHLRGDGFDTFVVENKTEILHEPSVTWILFNVAN